MIILTALLSFGLGTASGAYVLYRILPQRLRQHADYRERWQAAVRLLGAEGRLTGEQVAEILAPAAGQPSPGPVQPASSLPRPAASARGKAAAGTSLQVLHGMFSKDRRDLEIERARNGLPPLDDLAGMFSSDIREVMKARARHGTG